MKTGILFVERDVGGLNGELAAGGHGIARVHREIHDDLINLSRVGADRAQHGGGHHDQIDILADHAREHLQVFSDHLIQIEDLRGQHLLAAEGEELAGKRGGALRGAGDLLRGSAKSGVRTQTVEQKFGVT